MLTNALITECFYLQNDLTSVHFPRNMILSEQLVQSVPDLTEIEFEDGSIYDYYEGVIYRNKYQTAFAVPGGIESVTLREEVNIINDYCFSSCSKLKYITIQSNISEIRQYAFTNTNVSDIHFKSVTKIFKFAFRESLSKNITFEYGPITLSSHTFYSASINDIVFNGTQSIESQSFAYTNIVRAIFLETCSLESIDDQCFIGCKSLEEVILCSSIRKIEYSCFTDSINLKTIIFPENSSLNTIERNCFTRTIIESITLPKSLNNVQTQVFEQCKKLKTVIFESENVNIVSGAFTGCINLGSVTFNSISSLPLDIFTGCDSLNNITIRNQDSTLISYNGSVYSNEDKILKFVCNGATELYIYDKIVSIDSSAFSSCIKLKFISFPSNCSSLILYDSILSKINTLEEIIFPSYYNRVEFVGFLEMRVSEFF